MTKLKAVKQTGLDAVMGEFKPKKQNIDLTDNNHYDYESGENGVKTITHLDIKGYSLNGPYIVIQEHDDTQYVYRAEQFDLMKLYITE